MLAVVLVVASLAGFFLEKLFAWVEEHNEECFAYLAQQMNGR